MGVQRKCFSKCHNICETKENKLQLGQTGTKGHSLINLSLKIRKSISKTISENPREDQKLPEMPLRIPLALEKPIYIHVHFYLEARLK